MENAYLPQPLNVDGADDEGLFTCHDRCRCRRWRDFQITEFLFFFWTSDNIV